MLAGDAPVLVHNCSKTLGKNLRKNGEEPPPGTIGPEAHHIVPQKESAANPARQVLARIGLDMDSHFNGVWLGRQPHSGTFNWPRYSATIYPQWINDQIVNAYASGGAKHVMKVLSRTKRELAAMNRVFGQQLI
ncbi:AHH domain-containing protein [Luedemannella helvata]|uniref:Uncharacterized protein n=1 Tax=Luedemannella helvata TaxID=349315 RepID=A0ABN2KVW5_9ACTN